MNLTEKEKVFFTASMELATEENNSYLKAMTGSSNE
jgi:hypothetical protein